MPPRNRKTATETTTEPKVTPEADSSNGSSTGSNMDTETPETTSRRKKREALTGKDAVILSDFSVSEPGEAPGKQYSEPRDNPFDQAIQDSYAKNLEQNDRYLKFNTTSDAVENQCRLIRASAAYFKIGSKVRVQDNGDGTATVYFRGQERRSKKSRSTDVDAIPTDEQGNTVDDDDHEQDDVPAA